MVLSTTHLLTSSSQVVTGQATNPKKNKVISLYKKVLRGIPIELNEIPIDCLQRTFFFLSDKESLKLRVVCKLWKKLIPLNLTHQKIIQQKKYDDWILQEELMAINYDPDSFFQENENPSIHLIQHKPPKTLWNHAANFLHSRYPYVEGGLKNYVIKKISSLFFVLTNLPGTLSKVNQLFKNFKIKWKS